MRLQHALWKHLIRRAARRHGLIDPISFLSKIRSFSQPSEVKEPMNLLRAGLTFQARGLINSRAIQFNLDWVWPFWVEKQFDPADPSFIPRGYAPTHVNLTQRNWTAAGLPGVPLYPLVDPRGLVTPFYDGWSLDFWLFAADGRRLLPSKLAGVDQSLCFDPDLSIRTSAEAGTLRLKSQVSVEMPGDTPALKIRLWGLCGPEGRLAVGVRPYNPEGVQFIEAIAVSDDGMGLVVDGDGRVRFDRPPAAVVLSNYENGDVLPLRKTAEHRRVSCDIGMATAAALFPAASDGETTLEVTVPLDADLRRNFADATVVCQPWSRTLENAASLQVPDERVLFLFEAAKRTLVLLSSKEIYPGPYTYRRFWFRDAVLMGNAMLAVNLGERLGRHLRRFPERQKRDGFFESQEGEWDANGQVLWLIERWQRCLGKTLDRGLLEGVRKGAEWLIAKRVRDKGDKLRDGLLPAGFSAEHLGPNDYYYWDDFWGIAGLRAASRLMARHGFEQKARRLAAEADDFQAAVFRSIQAIPANRRAGGIPASPYRRMDAGAIGSMVADYPLQLTAPGDPDIRNTLEFLLEKCFFRGGFFQDMVHSGINIYLTLSLAQTLLRAGDARHRQLLRTAARLASPTGQWPEAIHPFSGGGCMGDGQHGWAAAEWIALLRNLFIREEDSTLVFGSGIAPQWLESDAVGYGPTATPHGDVSFRLSRADGGHVAMVEAEWHETAPPMRIAVPGFRDVTAIHTATPILLESRRH